MIFLSLVICIAFISMNTRNRIVKYEANAYGSSIYKADFFAEDLCVTNEEVEFDAFHTNDEFKGALLFDIENQKTLFFALYIYAYRNAAQSEDILNYSAINYRL